MNESYTDSVSQNTREIIKRFNDAFLHHDPVALPELVAEDCVIEDTQGAPNGGRHLGREACLNRWRPLAENRETQFELEETFVAEERAIIRWRYRWGKLENESVRGVNLMRVRNGQIVEAMGYVKSGD
jgi:ketosteroid isomerase-like protein